MARQYHFPFSGRGDGHVVLSTFPTVIRLLCFLSLCAVGPVAWASLINGGDDFLHTPQGGACINFSTPNNVCNGSASDIPLESVSIPGFPVTGIDTITQRGSISPSGSSTVSFQLAGLYLKSVNPVAVPGMPGTLADLYVTVNSNGVFSIPVYDKVPASTGSLTVDSNPASGLVKFNTNFTVYSDAIFVKHGTNPAVASNVLLHEVAPPIHQNSTTLSAMGTTNALPGSLVSATSGTPATAPMRILLSEFPEGGPEVRTFRLPFQVVPGDVVLGENGAVPNLMSVNGNGTLNTSSWSDVIVFAAGANNTSTATFYSDPAIPTFCSTPLVLVGVPVSTYPGSPHTTIQQVQVPCPGLVLSANAQGIPEIGPEGSNGAIYSPDRNRTYVFVSDVPEPAAWLLVSLGGMSLVWLRRRGSHPARKADQRT